MPTAAGKFQLQDYDAALVARGFEGYQPAERYQIINLGYRYIARKYPWTWEQTSGTFTINPGDPPLVISAATALNADSIDHAYVITDPYRRQLRPMRDEVFFDKWFSQSMTDAANRGIPDYYYVYEGQIFILSPPQTQLQVIIHFHQFLADLVALTDAPATPQILDEVILDAALVRAHSRAKELTLAAEAQMRVNEAIADMLQDDVWTMPEQQERVLPDDQWL